MLLLQFGQLPLARPVGGTQMHRVDTARGLFSSERKAHVVRYGLAFISLTYKF